MKERILYVILVFFLVLYAPFWLYLPALALGIIVFPLFCEAIVVALFVDYYYGPHVYAGSIFSFPFGLTAAILVLASIQLKERLRINL